MKDRINSFQKIAEANPDSNSSNEQSFLEHDEFLSDFFEENAQIRQALKDISGAIEETKIVQERILSSSVENGKESQVLDDLTAQIKRGSNRIRIQLKAMENNLKHQEDAVGVKQNAELRIRRSHHASISRMFHSLMAQYNHSQISFRDRCKDNIKRRIGIALGQSELSDEELESRLKSGDGAAVTMGIQTHSNQAEQMLMDIHRRHQDIIKLETSITELKDLFVDMACLVESQGDMVDQIDRHVEKAVNYVADGTRGVRAAVQRQKAARKKRIACMIIVGVIIAILVIILLSWLKN